MNKFFAVLYSILLSLWITSCAPDLEPQDEDGHWSPNENKIVYVCYKKQRVETGEFFSLSPFGPYGGIKGYILKEICITDAHGTYRNLITDNQSVDYDPHWSPNGEKIVFASRYPQSNENRLFITNKDGTDLQCLITSQEISFEYPKWSPDGGGIAFVEGYDGDLYIIKSDGTELKRLTTSGRIGNFDWAPNGEEIVFNSLYSKNNDTFQRDIFIVKVVNGQITQLTNDPIEADQPVWSPTGDYIAYRSGGEIYLLNTKNDERTQLTNTGGLVFDLIWHPRDPIIAYTLAVAELSLDADLFIQDINDQKIHSIHLGEQIDPFSILWSSDGQYLLFERFEDLNEDTFYESKLWAVDIETGEQWSISNNVDQYVTQMSP